MNRIPPKPIRRSELPAGDVLCNYCTAKCCRYFALSIDTPETFEDFEFIRWYLLHENTSLFTEDDTWYLVVHTVCQHLQSDNRCGIYETRPRICREYSTDDCEYDSDATYDRYFENAQQLTEYINARFSTPDNFRSPRPNRLPVIQTP